MTQGFYQNNGKWLNRDQLPVVFATSELIALSIDDWRLVELIRALHRDWDVLTDIQFKRLLEFHKLEICMDENNPQEYLLLRRVARQLE